MSNKKVIKPVALAVGAALAGAFAFGSVASADTVESPFALSTMSTGYMMGDTEGTCGEGTCGGDKEGSSDEGKDAEASCGGDKDGSADTDKDAEASCGGDKDSSADGEKRR